MRNLGEEGTRMAGLTFKLHPLVIVNISDHYTRVKSQMNSPALLSGNTDSNGGDASQQSVASRVYGCVIGMQRGRTVEIFNSLASVRSLNSLT